jgi:hypothetical protein
MPKFLAGCHYNIEEISRHLLKNTGYGPVQTNGNKFATSQILRKPVEVVKGRILGPLYTRLGAGRSTGPIEASIGTHFMNFFPAQPCHM